MRSRRNRGNIFVANLPEDFADERLAEAFDPFGIVLSATVARDPETGRRLRYGFVDIATEKAARAAIAGLNGTAIDGCAIEVKVSERTAASAAKGRPGRPGRPAPRSAAARPAATDAAAPLAVAAAAAPRPTRSFQVERRPLPRRIPPLTRSA